MFRGRVPKRFAICLSQLYHHADACNAGLKGLLQLSMTMSFCDIRFAGPFAVVQRAVLPAIQPIARAMGLRAFYEADDGIGTR